MGERKRKRSIAGNRNWGRKAGNCRETHKTHPVNEIKSGAVEAPAG
jgi:hypothetical protein